MPNYTTDDIQKAFEAIKNGMPFLRASREFNIPKTTLIRKWKNGMATDKPCGRPPRVLNRKQEEILSTWIEELFNNGKPLTRDDILNYVEIILKEFGNKTKFQNSRPGRKWYTQFLKRNPSVADKIVQQSTITNLSEEDAVISSFRQIKKEIISEHIPEKTTDTKPKKLTRKQIKINDSDDDDDDNDDDELSINDDSNSETSSIEVIETIKPIKQDYNGIEPDKSTTTTETIIKNNKKPKLEQKQNNINKKIKIEKNNDIEEIFINNHKNHNEDDYEPFQLICETVFDNNEIENSNTTMKKCKIRNLPSSSTSISKQNIEINSDYDEDKQFLLSLMGYFKRLSHQKKSLAKLKILQYLTELELNKKCVCKDKL